MEVILLAEGEYSSGIKFISEPFSPGYPHLRILRSRFDRLAFEDLELAIQLILAE
jgi:hypothetical protein